jgi:hypothetical protein
MLYSVPFCPAVLGILGQSDSTNWFYRWEDNFNQPIIDPQSDIAGTIR